MLSYCFKCSHSRLRHSPRRWASSSLQNFLWPPNFQSYVWQALEQYCAERQAAHWENSPRTLSRAHYFILRSDCTFQGGKIHKTNRCILTSFMSSQQTSRCQPQNFHSRFNELDETVPRLPQWRVLGLSSVQTQLLDFTHIFINYAENGAIGRVVG